MVWMHHSTSCTQKAQGVGGGVFSAVPVGGLLCSQPLCTRLFSQLYSASLTSCRGLSSGLLAFFCVAPFFLALVLWCTLVLSGGATGPAHILRAMSQACVPLASVGLTSVGCLRTLAGVARCVTCACAASSKVLFSLQPWLLGSCMGTSV